MDRVLSILPLNLRKTKMERVVALLSQVIHGPSPFFVCKLMNENVDTGIGMSPEELRTNLVRLYSIAFSNF